MKMMNSCRPRYQIDVYVNVDLFSHPVRKRNQLLVR